MKETQDAQTNILSTKAEKEIMRAKAKKIGMSLTGYLRFLGLNAEVEVVTPKVKIK